MTDHKTGGNTFDVYSCRTGLLFASWLYTNASGDDALCVEDNQVHNGPYLGDDLLGVQHNDWNGLYPSFPEP